MNPTARVTIQALSKALAAAGIDLPDEVTGPIDQLEIHAPTDEEIAHAIAAAKGDPTADKTVQRLLAARTITRSNFTDLLEQEQWSNRLGQIHDNLEDLNAQLHDRFDQAATTLTEQVGNLTGYTNLDELHLSTLPRPLVEPARTAIDAQNTLRAVVNAWQTLWTRLTGARLDGRHRVLAACDPAPEQWQEHATRRPATVPDASDYWGLARIDWPLDLAHSPREARQREQHIFDTLDHARDEKIRRKGIATSWGTYR